MKIAAIADLHYSKEINPQPERCGERAVGLLNKALDMIHNDIKPDILLVAGDLINDAKDLPLLQELAEILRKVEIPCLIIPGNHDPEPEIFYQYMPRPADYLDVNGFRFVSFPYDVETPGWNSYRDPAEIARLEKIGNELPTVIFQHVPLFRKGRVGCAYNYDNADEIIARMPEKVVLAVSGHWHFGFCPSFSLPFASVAVPSLCEKDFAVSEIELNDSGKMTSFTVRYLA